MGQIAGIYTPEQFRAIEKDERKRMGLRAVDLHEVHPQFTRPGATENKILKLQDVGLYYKKQAIVEHINLSQEWEKSSVLSAITVQERQLFPVLCADCIKKPVDNSCGMKNHKTGKKGCTAPTWSCGCQL